MHEEYISSKENYIEYWNRLDNQMLINSKIKQAKEAEEKAKKAEQKVIKAEQKVIKAEKKAKEAEEKAQEYEKQAQHFEEESKKLSDENNKLQKEKEVHLQRIIKSMNQYIQMKFDENMSEWLNQLNEEQVYKIQDHLYEFNCLEELKTNIVEFINQNNKFSL